MTVKEIRERNIIKLAERNPDYENNKDKYEAMARKAMNSFYRLAGYNEKLFYINNDKNLYKLYKNDLNNMELKEDRWIKRVNKYFEPFRAKVIFNGIYPSVCDNKYDPSGCVTDLFLTSWYN